MLKLAALLAALFIAPFIHADTGCDMTPNSDLMKCLGDYASIPPIPTATASADQANELCQIYSSLAACWAKGTYCREWLPMQVAADKICALATLASVPTSTITTQTSKITLQANITTSNTASANTSDAAPVTASDSASTRTTTTASNTVTSSVATLTPTTTPVPSATLDSVIAEASNVITSIWNNDSGTDIPVISNDVGTKTQPTWTKEGETSPGSVATGTVGSSSSTNGASQSAAQLALVVLGVSLVFVLL